MKITLSQVPEGGLSSETECQASLFDLDTEDGSVTRPVVIGYSVFLEGEELVAHLSIHCVRGLVCARCLTPFEDEFSKEVDLVTPTRGLKVVDFTDDIRQEIVMEYPIKPLCQENCKGVCPQCGQNLNETTCDCRVKEKNGSS